MLTQQCGLWDWQWIFWEHVEKFRNAHFYAMRKNTRWESLRDASSHIMSVLKKKKMQIMQE